MIDIPITVIGTNPPRFRYTQVVDTPVGSRAVEHEGPLPPAVEGAVVALVRLCESLGAENERLLRMVEEQSKSLELAQVAEDAYDAAARGGKPTKAKR